MNWTWILLLALLFLGGVTYWFITQSKQYREQAKGRCIVFRPTHGGDLEWQIVKLKGAEITIPIIDPDSPKEKKGTCVINKATMFNLQYPIGTGWPPAFMRATIKAVMIPEGSAVAWSPFEKGPVMDEQTLNAMKTSKVIQDLVQTGYEHFYKKTEGVVGSLKPSHLVWAVIAIFVGLLGCGYGIYMIIQEQSKFSSWMGL
jgi:hypothetical protein